MSELVTSLRMYNTSPAVADAWRALFTRVFADCDVHVRFVEHSYPQPIDALWREPGLCCAFMCGWPFARADRVMQAIAAPVPALARYAGLPRYCSELLVRAQSAFDTLEATFGHRIGFMALDSQSGYNAPRALLATHAAPGRSRLYAEARGPYVTPARTLDALLRDEVDVIALDSYYLDLVRHENPQRLAGTRTIATTPWTPIPLLVAAPGVDSRVVARLRDRLLELHRVPTYAPLLTSVLVARLVAADVPAYAAMETMARDTVAQGYAAIG